MVIEGQNVSPAPKADNDLAKATFYTDCANVKKGLALGVRVDAMVVCRARHMFLKVSQSYHVVVTLASLRPSQKEAKGSQGQGCCSDGTPEGSLRQKRGSTYRYAPYQKK